MKLNQFFSLFRYGYTFLYETYLYHLVRKDIRHNFSPYFYMLYLNSNNEIFDSDSIFFKIISFLPQISLILGISIFSFRHFKLCLFLITFSFVCLNKVITSQVSSSYYRICHSISLNFIF